MSSNYSLSDLELSIEALRVAMIAGDRESLVHLTADELAYGHGAGHVESKVQFIDKLASGRSGWSSIAITDQKVTLADNLAVVHHIFLGASRNPPDGIVNKKIAVLSVWLQRDGRWQLLARQAVQLNA
jgi:hypothetical protein